jgi:hypothetical protein
MSSPALLRTPLPRRAETALSPALGPKNRLLLEEGADPAAAKVIASVAEQPPQRDAILRIDKELQTR